MSGVETVNSQHIQNQSFQTNKFHHLICPYFFVNLKSGLN